MFKVNPCLPGVRGRWPTNFGLLLLPQAGWLAGTHCQDRSRRGSGISCIAFPCCSIKLNPLLLAMAYGEACLSLLVMAATVAATAYCRRLARQLLRPQGRSHSFVLELSGAFQICACTHELRLLADLPPRPHVVLALTYIVTALHGLTLPGSANNPSSSFQHFAKGRIRRGTWWLQTSAQFIGAILALIYIKCIWLVGMVPAHSKALAENCSGPIQTTIANAFLLELLFSFLLHLTLLQCEPMDHKAKVHVVALLITMLAYEGSSPFPHFPFYCLRLKASFE